MERWLREREGDFLAHIEDDIRIGAFEMKPELQRYQVESDLFWQALPMYGGDGYDAIDLAERRKWTVISAWGKDGYDLGNWPLVIVFFRNLKDGRFQLVEYVEGDVNQYDCPSAEIRQQITDEIAFWHWKFKSERWVEDYEDVDQLPAELRGPYWSRQAEACPCSACVADQQSMQKEH